MKAVLQRMTEGSVSVEGEIVAHMGVGLLMLIGVEPTDTVDDADILAEKIVLLRIFEDENGKMNKSLLDIGGGVLAVPNFTLLADARKGRRPSYTGAAAPELANSLFERFVAAAKDEGAAVEKGIFGAHMQINFCNDGPVTLLLDTADWRKNR